jgi:hypothetical protein
MDTNDCELPLDMISVLSFVQTPGWDALQSDLVFQKLCEEKEP